MKSFLDHGIIVPSFDINVKYTIFGFIKNIIFQKCYLFVTVWN